jgi:hypothetical protein
MATIVLDGDASGAVRAAGLAERAMRRVSGAVDDLDKRHKASAFSGRNLAERLTDIDKAAQIVGGPLSSLTPMLNDFGDAIEQVGLRTAVTNVAAAGLASGGLAVMIAGVTAAAGALIGLGVNAVAVSSDIAGFDAILGANSSTMQRNRADLVALGGAVDDLSLSWAAARVEAAGLAAPVMTELGYAAAGVAGGLQTVARAIDDGADSWSVWGTVLVTSIPVLGSFVQVLDLAWDSTKALAEAGRENAAALREQAAGAAAYLVVAPGLAAEADSIEASWGALPFDMVADSMDRVRASVLATTPTVRANRVQAREAAEDYSFLADSAREAAAAVAAASQLRADQATVAGLPSAMTSTTFGVGPDERQAMTDAEAASAAESARLQTEASDLARERITSNFAAIGGAALDLSSTVADAMAQAFEQGGDRSEKARKKQFAAMKAVSLLQAGINTALAISNVWASWASVPPVAAALTAVAAGVGAAQIGMIAAKSYHRGGLLPDETMIGPARVRRNETQAVITAQGMDALGGSNGLARVNAGMAPPEPGPIVLVIGGRTQRTRPFAGADPGYGHRARGR